MRNFLILVLLLTGCARHHSTNYTVSVGEKFSIEHSSNPSTGYHWVVDMNGVCDIDSVLYVQDPAPEGYCGVGGTETHHFTAVYQGIDTLNFVYKRGDGDVAEIRRYTVWVR
jgi:inhibitor of cysteine peptidase